MTRDPFLEKSSMECIYHIALSTLTDTSRWDFYPLTVTVDLYMYISHVVGADHVQRRISNGNSITRRPYRSVQRSCCSHNGRPCSYKPTATGSHEYVLPPNARFALLRRPKGYFEFLIDTCGCRRRISAYHIQPTGKKMFKSTLVMKVLCLC